MHQPDMQNSMKSQHILHQLLFGNNSIAMLKQKPVSEINILELSNESMQSNLLSSISSNLSQEKQNYQKLKKLSQIMQRYSKRVYENINNAQKEKLIHMKTNLKEIRTNQISIQTTEKQNQKTGHQFIEDKINFQIFGIESSLLNDKLVKLEQVPINSKLRKQQDKKKRQNEIPIYVILSFILVIVYCAFLIF